MRKVLATAVVLGLLATGATAAGASVRADDSAVTKDQIKVGITYVDTASLKSRGINIDHGDYETSYKAVINDINARAASTAGRSCRSSRRSTRLAPIPRQAGVRETDRGREGLRRVGFFLNDGPLCYLEQHDTPVVGGTITSEYLAAKAPWYTLEAGDQASAQVVDVSAQKACSRRARSASSPTRRSSRSLDNGYSRCSSATRCKVTSAIIDAPASDTVAAQAQADTIIQRFKSDGIKTILAAGNAIVAAGRGVAKTPDYRPRARLHLAEHDGRLRQRQEQRPQRDGERHHRQRGRGLQQPGIAEVLRPRREGDGSHDHRDATAGHRESRHLGKLGMPLHRTVRLTRDGGRQEPHDGDLWKGSTESRFHRRPGVWADELRRETHTFAEPVFLYRFDPATKTLVKDPEPVSTSGKDSGTKSN